MRKTKIICTLGPSTDKDGVLEELIKEGMNVARFNFSHGLHDEQKGRIDKLKEIRTRLNKPVAALLDTKGPEIRICEFADGKITLKEGQEFTLTADEIEGNEKIVSVTYKDLYKDVKPGGFILVNDGQVELLVDHVEGTDIVCICANDGIVKNKRGINVPGIKLGFDYLSEKDIGDLTFGCQQGVDFIAASFVRRPQDVLDVKKLLIENGRPEIQIIAKIENSEGVENMDEILKVADGIMVARGDLGVEVPAEDVPLIQKSIIKKCKQRGKIVITATQMLESMQQNPRPTRAEVSDVANAIYDGTDAIMLSGESASGLYPQEAVLMMSKIAHKIESNLDYQSLQRQAIRTAPDDTSEAICMSVAEIAYKFNVAAIIAFTESGFTARKMARYRTKSRIIAATPSLKTVRALALNWGVKAVPCKPLNSRISMIDYASIIARENGVKPGQKILVTGGTPGVKGATSYLELVEVK